MKIHEFNEMMAHLTRRRLMSNGGLTNIEDIISKAFEKILKQKGKISISDLTKDTGYSKPTIYKYLSENQKSKLISQPSPFKDRITKKTELNVMESFNPKISKNKSSPDILLLGNLHPEIQLSAINQLNNKPSAIILDTMNYWIENFWDTLEEVISKVDIISINDEESEMITGHENLKNAAEVLHSMGPKYVIIKYAPDGRNSSCV